MARVLHHNEARVHGFSAAVLHGKDKDGKNVFRNVEVLLRPGRNTLGDEQYDALMDRSTGSKAFQDMVRDKAIIVYDGGLVVTKMSVESVLGAIEAETDSAGVQDILDQESRQTKPRKTVVQAASERLQLLKDADEEAERARQEHRSVRPKGKQDEARE